MSIKCFLKAAARFLLGSSTACTAGLWGGRVAPSSVILQWSHSSSQGLLPDWRMGDCTSSFRGCWFLIITVYGVYLIYSRMGYGTAALRRVLLWGRCGLGVQRWVTSRGGLSLFFLFFLMFSHSRLTAQLLLLIATSDEETTAVAA